VETSAVQNEREIVRRFDSAKAVRKAKKSGFAFDPNEGQGIPATSTNVDPVDPDEIKTMTGARNADAFMDIDITGKQVLRWYTKAGHKELVIQEDVAPEDIVATGRTRKSVFEEGEVEN
jgi:hypothetical protein